MIPHPAREERLSPRQSHGVKALKRAVKTLGSRTIDQRTRVGKALAAYRSGLIADLGGIESLSRQELALVEEVVITSLILSSVNAWILAQKSLVSARSKMILPAVRDRNSLVNTLKGLLEALGLKRRAKELPKTLTSWLSEEPALPDQSLDGAQTTDGPSGPQHPPQTGSGTDESSVVARDAEPPAASPVLGGPV